VIGASIDCYFGVIWFLTGEEKQSRSSTRAMRTVLEEFRDSNHKIRQHCVCSGEKSHGMERKDVDSTEKPQSTPSGIIAFHGELKLSRGKEEERRAVTKANLAKHS